jgi:hypothetical protein
VLSAFDKDYSKPADRAVRDKRSVFAGTTGLYPSAKQDPSSYKNNPFERKLSKNPDAKSFYNDGVFPVSSAQQSQNFLDSLNDDNPRFSDSGNQSLATKFAKDYAEGVARGLINEDDSVSHENLATIQSQHPTQGIGTEDAVTRMRLPGANGVKT